MTAITRLRRALGDNASMPTHTLKILFASCLSSTAALAQAATAIVDVGGTGQVFLPQTVSIHVGDTVTFVNKGGFHNAVADDGSFRCARGCDGDGHGGNGNASSTNWVAKVTFSQVGRVGYFCEIHGMPGSGMFGTIVVKAVTPVRLQSFEVD